MNLFQALILSTQKQAVMSVLIEQEAHLRLSYIITIKKQEWKREDRPDSHFYLFEVFRAPHSDKTRPIVAHYSEKFFDRDGLDMFLVDISCDPEQGWQPVEDE